MTSPASGELFVGIMSGTSLDGIDVAIVAFEGDAPHIVHAQTTAYDAQLRQALRRLCNGDAVSVSELYRHDALLGDAYAEAVNDALAAAGLDAHEVAAIGCHGQTLWHSPDTVPAFTVQIGDPNRIAAATGITTVADFRRMDVALGGQGAPLAPLLHRALFHHPDEDRVIANIGGIANITVLPASDRCAISACDTGPGNTLADAWIERHRELRFDRDGEWARGGKIIESLLAKWLHDEPYFAAAAPKTTGTDYFNLARFESSLVAEQDPRDVMATLVELTARSLGAEMARLPLTHPACYVCGGGAQNPFLLERLAAALPDWRVDSTAALGIDPDYVEATAFAWLARERLAGRAVQVVDITHASRNGILGGLYLAD
ncbi:MAG: anhydro-N-acetylmuramic acid kinase [Gammaproteobacteria bacterium]|nr:anhydro-N-acetylmuramic acid kinase [Gammaproteobacteria bacterium]